MENSRYLDCLAADFGRLRAVAGIDPAASVPTCPGWTVADLTRHVGEVYLHKTLAIREGAEPEPWPPAALAAEEPIALLDRAYAALRHELGSHAPTDPAGSWYAPDQTVGFWIRRMAQETVIHRIDAELGAGQPVAPLPADLAVDGVDELLKIFVGYCVGVWTDDFKEILDASPGRSYALRTDGAAWRVRIAPGTFTVEDGDAADADVTVGGPPAALLRWVWHRQPGGEVTVDGPAGALDQLHACITKATQ
ncbi:maleylpyruvate isomerase family mycothiol-dependent enzyme [Asanoa sp. NPDC049573]|uniref:maleylpyruvate isomerase family mycothiol-dependent enzyme n=1 Tax=Asanoa sp. NPDC049573 TaxID=3155396 RepID=UPI003428E104